MLRLLAPFCVFCFGSLRQRASDADPAKTMFQRCMAFQFPESVESDGIPAARSKPKSWRGIDDERLDMKEAAKGNLTPVV
jgi:hypothetical protein